MKQSSAKEEEEEEEVEEVASSSRSLSYLGQEDNLGPRWGVEGCRGCVCARLRMTPGGGGDSGGGGYMQ